MEQVPRFLKPPPCISSIWRTSSVSETQMATSVLAFSVTQRGAFGRWLRAGEVR